MKLFLLLVSTLIIFSCTSQNIKIADNKEAFERMDIDQQSVVATNFKNSFLYEQFDKWRIEGPIIPGLQQTVVPQGMAYWEEKNLMVISNYMSDDTAGTLTVINMGDETFYKVLYLFNADKTPHIGHLGGVAISSRYLWIASGSGIYFIDLKTILDTTTKSKIYLPELIETETKGSFSTFSNNILWIGEFTRENGSYSVPESHHIVTRDSSSHRGWLGGYKLDALTDMINMENTINGKIIPDYIFSIPDEIQGAVFIHDKILLSASYGRKNYSRLLLFHNPMEEKYHKDFNTVFKTDIPFWFLDNINKIGEINVPPMSEAATVYQNTIAVLFESASSKYRDTASFPLDRIQFLTLDVFGVEQ